MIQHTDCCANKTRWCDYPHPSGPLNEPGGRARDRNPEYRDADEPHGGGRISNTLALQTMAG